MARDISKHKRAFVLLSGGVDSATCLYLAREHMKKVGGKVQAYSMNYGQRHLKETECAENLCKGLGIKFKVIDIRGFATGMLTDNTQIVPDISYDEIKGISPTYVPFRNGFMLSRLAAEAQQYANEVSTLFDPNEDGGNYVPEDLVWMYFGAHAEDSENWAYPDCTPEFIGAMANAIYIGTYRAVRLLTPFAFSSKADIIRTGRRLKVLSELYRRKAAVLLTKGCR